MKIVLLQGGNSPEVEISLRSSAAIGSAITQLGHELVCINPADFSQIEGLVTAIRSHHPDLVFIGLHGGDGEDGTMQAVLKAAGLPFTGSSALASGIAMDKYIASTIASANKIPTPEQQLITAGHSLQDVHLEPPLVVKPNSAGSSVGIHIVSRLDELQPAIADALLYDTQVLVQKFVKGRELSVSVLGEEVLPPIEIKPLTGFYDYQNKYSKGKTEYICPAELSPEETQRVQAYTLRVFQALGCSVYGRVDFIFDGADFFFLEVNTLPGMTELSLVPMAAKAVGIDFVGLIGKIINS